MEIPTTPVHLPTRRPFSILEILQFAVFACVVLYFGRTLLIPLAFAILVSLVLYPMCKWLEKKGIGRLVAIFLSLTAVTIVIGAIISLLFAQLVEFAGELHTFEIKFIEARDHLTNYISTHFGVSPERQAVLYKKYFGDLTSRILPLVQNTFHAMSESFAFLLLTIVFSALISMYRQMLANAVYQLFPSNATNSIHEILADTIGAFYNFMKGMFYVYLIVGILNSAGLAIIGVPHPIVFGFTASILTFIPYFGILVASLLPITVTWIEFNSIWYPIGVVIVFTIVQLLEAYVIFPYVVGSRLKINTLAIIIAIVAGGILWGGAGMILFIPFLSIVKLIADRSPDLKTLSLLLGEGKRNKTKPDTQKVKEPNKPIT